MRSQTSQVGAWYAAPSRMFSANLSGRTLRQIVHLHAGGTVLRLRLSNRYGDGPVTLSLLSVGSVLSGPVTLLGVQTVRFAGQSTVTLEPGRDIVSDPVSLHVKAFSDLTITFFLAQGESLTGHMSVQQISYISGPGNVTAVPTEASFFVYPLQTLFWWLVTVLMWFHLHLSMPS